MTNCVEAGTFKYNFTPKLSTARSSLPRQPKVARRGAEIPAIKLFQAPPIRAATPTTASRSSRTWQDLQLQRPDDSASAPQGGDSSAGQKSLAEALYLTVSNEYCNELDGYTFVNTSHTTYDVKTAGMSTLQKSALLLWLFHFEHKYGEDRAH